jgi:hypothetical protein
VAGAGGDEQQEGEGIGDLAAELLGGATAEQPAVAAERIVALPPDEGFAVLRALGRSRRPEAAPILAAVAEGNGAKALRKEARRGLHQLRALGLKVPRPSAPANTTRLPERLAEPTEAWATLPDGVGSRLLFLAAERPLGGLYWLSLVLNEVVGMKAGSISDTTRKRYREQLEASKARQAYLGWIQLPPRYASQLIGEAIELNRESGFAIPQDFQFYQASIAGLSQPFERALVYDELPAAEVMLNPDYLEESPEILEEEELQAWFFGFDEVHRYSLDLLQARQSRIVLSEQLQQERINGILANAIRDVVTPPIQRGLRRRLEETAYVLLKTDRALQARRAVAAAQQLGEGALTLSPFLRQLMERSLEIVAEVETAKVPIELVRRSPYDPIE